MKIVGLVLAGGQGRRLGGADKALLPLGTRPLIHHVLARLSPQVADVAISANGDPARFVAFGCAVLPDAEPDLVVLREAATAEERDLLVRTVAWAIEEHQLRGTAQ